MQFGMTTQLAYAKAAPYLAACKHSLCRLIEYSS
jgi:hypothetical protein